MDNEHDSNSNHHSIPCYQFNHEYSYNSNNHTRTIVLYCIISYTLFPEFFLLFSYQFYLFFLFSYQFLFFMFPLEFFSLFSHFFSVFSVYQVLYSVIRCKHAKKKRKKCDVWCQRCHRGQIKLRFAKHEEKVWIGWTVFLFTVPKIHAQKHTQNLNDCKRSKR